MRFHARSFLILAWIVLPASGQARVFDINRESFAAYFAGTAGTSNLGTGAVSGESGSTVTFSGKSSNTYSGEFGFLYSRPELSFRFGFEFLNPSALSGSTANNGTNDLYSVDSRVQAYLPKISLEFNLRPAPDSRSFLGFTAGAASVTVENSYTLTATGSSTWAGMDTSAKYKGTGTLLGLSLGHEGHVSDTTTYAFELGYRYLNINSLTYSSAANVFGSSHASGDTVKTSSGADRKLDLSGLYLSLSFRFYL